MRPTSNGKEKIWGSTHDPKLLYAHETHKAYEECFECIIGHHKYACFHE